MVDHFIPRCFFCDELVQLEENLTGIFIQVGETKRYVYAHLNHVNNFSTKLKEYKAENFSNRENK